MKICKLWKRWETMKGEGNILTYLLNIAAKTDLEVVEDDDTNDAPPAAAATINDQEIWDEFSDQTLENHLMQN